MDDLSFNHLVLCSLFIFSEPPIAAGPKQYTAPLCLGCSAPVTLSSYRSASPERLERGGLHWLLKLGKWGLMEYSWNMLESFLGSVAWALRACTRHLSCPGFSSRTRTKIFFSSPYTISLQLSPLPSKLGRLSCRLACLLKYVSGRDVVSIWCCLCSGGGIGGIIIVH